ncbi:hypothetical protein KJR08_01005 [Streptococcus lutetiensis]|uniref:hypothetical protein n=1 Tax=Streptococcus lutetiensis TaxID=150055 RepID=UPI001BD9AF1C|nr:hypothetical protein [Streptococcus lutetiensis]MBT0946964.1 hypothetical protein [Streptococcus lutetiensis]
MTNKLNNIQKSLDNTNFTNFLNQYNSFLLKSEDINFVMDTNLVMQDVVVLIKFLYEQQISRVPYDTITSKVNEFNDHTDETIEKSDSFDFLIQATSDSLKTIVDCFVKDGTFDGEKVTSSAKTKYEDAIYAFYKVLEHTKLAYTQYQNLYKKTENEVQELYSVTQESIEEYKKLKKVAHELKRNYSNLNIEIISVLGIFASIIFAVFGGVSQLGQLGENLNEAGLGKIFIFVGSSSFLLFSALFIAFNTTAHLTDRNMKACCNKNGCSHHIKEKYPVYFWSIIISIIMIAFGTWIEFKK